MGSSPTRATGELLMLSVTISFIGVSSNGRTIVSGTMNVGSSPATSAVVVAEWSIALDCDSSFRRFKSGRSPF